MSTIPDAVYERILLAPAEVSNVSLAAELSLAQKTVWSIRNRRERRAIRIARRIGLIRPYGETTPHTQTFDDRRAYVVKGTRG